MKRNVPAATAMAVAVILSTLLIGPAFTGSNLRLAFAASDTSSVKIQLIK
jgi:hypothetical protein